MTEPLPDPLKKLSNNPDDATQQELENYIDMCMTELVADMDEDHVIQKTTEDPISLNNIRKRGIDNCGFEGIRSTDVDDSSCVFEFTVDDPEQGNTNGETTNQHAVAMDKIITKRRLTELSIRAIRRHVSNIGDVEHINPNQRIGAVYTNVGRTHVQRFRYEPIG